MGTTRPQFVTDETKEKGEEGTFEVWRRLIAENAAVRGITANTITRGFLDGSSAPVTFLFMYNVLLMSTVEVGGYIGALLLPMALLMPLTSKLSDQYVGRRMLIALPAMCITPAVILAQSLCTPDTVLSFCALGMLNGAALAFIIPNLTPYVLENVTVDDRARTQALIASSEDIGRIAGAASMGYVAMEVGLPAAMQVLAVVRIAGISYLSAVDRQVGSATVSTRVEAKVTNMGSSAVEVFWKERREGGGEEGGSSGQDSTQEGITKGVTDEGVRIVQLAPGEQHLIEGRRGQEFVVKRGEDELSTHKMLRQTESIDVDSPHRSKAP
jgi:MFS family permease